MASHYDPDTESGWAFEGGAWVLYQDGHRVARRTASPFPDDEHTCNDYLADYG